MVYTKKDKEKLLDEVMPLVRQARKCKDYVRLLELLESLAFLRKRTINHEAGLLRYKLYPTGV